MQVKAVALLGVGLLDLLYRWRVRPKVRRSLGIAVMSNAEIDATLGGQS